MWGKKKKKERGHSKGAVQKAGSLRESQESIAGHRSALRKWIA